jgi:hypothetical protein
MEKKRGKSAQLDGPLGIVLEKHLPVTPFDEREREKRRSFVGICTLKTKLPEIWKSVLKINGLIYYSVNPR